jgi:oxygen-dependent protoporphyrinogen oxidase
MERTHGSLGRAMLAARKTTKKVGAVPRQPAPPLFTSLKNGMQQLAEAVASRLTPSAVLHERSGAAIQREAGGWVVSAGLQSDQFDAVILALPAPAAAQVLAHGKPSELAANLRPSRTVRPSPWAWATVVMFASRSRRALDFWFRAAKARSLLAATFVHNKFPHRAPEDRALLRCFFAGRTAEDLWGLTDDQIVEIVRNELQQILGPQIKIGLRAPLRSPLFARVYKWKSAMAQYGVGHLDRLDRIERLRRGCRASRWRATLTAASACQTVSAPAATRPSR